MPNNVNFIVQNFIVQNVVMSLPMLLAGAVGLVMVSIFRTRATGAANLAMWCLIVILLNTIFGTVLYAMVPRMAGENFRSIYMALNLGRQLIHGAALVGLVYAIFQDRLSEADTLPELDEWSDR
jgi:hypothetical protein